MAFGPAPGLGIVDGPRGGEPVAGSCFFLGFASDRLATSRGLVDARAELDSAASLPEDVRERTLLLAHRAACGVIEEIVRVPEHARHEPRSA